MPNGISSAGWMPALAASKRSTRSSSSGMRSSSRGVVMRRPKSGHGCVSRYRPAHRESLHSPPWRTTGSRSIARCGTSACRSTSRASCTTSRRSWPGGPRCGRSSSPSCPTCAGRTLVHPQCHFGEDTLSWARRGARVTGLDFSGPAIEAARALASRCELDAEFVEANVYDASEALGGRRFDIVYTGLGALNWLPDIERWARVMASLVAPGGLPLPGRVPPLLARLRRRRPERRVPVLPRARPAVRVPEHGQLRESSKTNGLQQGKTSPRIACPWPGLSEQRNPGSRRRFVRRQSYPIDRTGWMSSQLAQLDGARPNSA